MPAKNIRKGEAGNSGKDSRGQAGRVISRAQHRNEATDHLVDVINDIVSDSKTAQNMSLGRTKATAIAKHVIGDCYFESLSEILMRNKFSILIDESADIGNVKTLRVLVRFFDEGTNRVQTRFWKLVHIF